MIYLIVLIMYYEYEYFILYIYSKLSMFDLSKSENDW
jgi:hypothetical protein